MELILLLLSSLLLTTRPAGASNAVLDVDGNELQRGQRYYVTSVLRPGGGLTLASLNESCPLYLAQAPFNDWLGAPLSFLPENPNDETAKEGRTLNIMFPKPTECPQSTVWTLDRETRYVTTGGTTSSSIGPVRSRFAIRKVEDSTDLGYQIEVCPCSVGVDRGSCRMGCLGSLGVVREKGKTLIGVNGDRPHTVQFVKVKKVEQGSMIRSDVESPN